MSSSKPCQERVAELLREIPEDDWLSVGFSDRRGREADVRSVLKAEIEPHEVDAGIVHDTFWINVREPLATNKPRSCSHHENPAGSIQDQRDR